MSDDKTYKVVANDVAQFLSLVDSHNFSSKDIDSQFNIKTRDGKRYRWQILEEKVKSGELQKINSTTYRKIQTNLEEIDWQRADVEDTLNLSLPLNLHKWIKIYHRGIHIIAGSPGAGKTAFLYDLTLRNMYHLRGINIYTNDMTAEEILERLSDSGYDIPVPAPFKMYDRADNFGDVIDPNGINIIDYLDINSEVYLIGEEIEKIYSKLDRGVAFIGIQKKPGQELGMGGIFSSKRAKLYLSLDSIKDPITMEYIHKLVVHKARGRVDKTINPRTLDIKFKLVNGIKFIQV